MAMPKVPSRRWISIGSAAAALAVAIDASAATFVQQALPTSSVAGFDLSPQKKPAIQKSIDAWVTLLGLDPAKTTKIRDDGKVRAVRYGDAASREVDFYVVKNLGHEWPGRPRVLPRRVTGESSNAVDATALVWEFFKKHPREN